MPYARSLADYHELLQQQREGTLKGCFVPAADLLYSCRNAMRQSMHRFPVGDGWGISGRRDLLRHLFHWTDSELYRRGCCISPNLREPVITWEAVFCFAAALLCSAAGLERKRRQ